MYLTLFLSLSFPVGRKLVACPASYFNYKFHLRLVVGTGNTSEHTTFLFKAPSHAYWAAAQKESLRENEGDLGEPQFLKNGK